MIILIVFVSIAAVLGLCGAITAAQTPAKKPSGFLPTWDIQVWDHLPRDPLGDPEAPLVKGWNTLAQIEALDSGDARDKGERKIEDLFPFSARPVLDSDYIPIPSHAWHMPSFGETREPRAIFRWRYRKTV